METGSDLVAEPSQVFTQVESRGQFPNRSLPQPDLLGSRWPQQPGGQGVFTGPRTRRAQEFEERALPHQIEIIRIGVVWIPEALALRAAPSPARFEAGEGPFVERHGTQRALPFGKQAIVREEQHDKDQDRRHQPARCESLAPEDEPRHDRANCKYQQAQIRGNRRVPRPDRRRFAAGAQAAHIFGVSASP
jgi:hypothetical protein